MAKDQNITPKEDSLDAEGSVPEKKPLEGLNMEQAEPSVESQAEAVEKITPEDEVARNELRKKIETMDLYDSLKPHVQAQVSQAQALKDQEKLQYLLALAKHKGVVFAVHVAQKMNNPYLLDALHDTLEKEGNYKRFVK